MILNFTSEQVDFLNEELNLGIMANKEYELKKEECYKILDYCMDVEIDETDEAEERPDNILSHRGEIAVQICNLFTR